MRRTLGLATIALLVAATLVGGPVAATDHDTFPATITDENVEATVTAYDEAAAAQLQIAAGVEQDTYWVNEDTGTAYHAAYEGEQKVVQTYRDGTTARYRVVVDGLETSTGTTDDLRIERLSSGAFLRMGLVLGDATAEQTDVTQTKYGRHVGVYTVTGQAAADAMERIDRSWVSDATAADAKITLHATENGRITYVSYNRPAVDGAFSIRIRGLDSTTVPEPAWYGTPRGTVTVEPYNLENDGFVGVEVLYGGNLDTVRVQTTDGTVLQTRTGKTGVLEPARAPRGLLLDAATVTYDVRGERIEVVGVANGNEVVLTTYAVPTALNDSDRDILRYLERA